MLLAETKREASRLATLLDRSFKRHKLVMSLEKTKVVQLGREKEAGVVEVENEALEEVKEFCYLGSQFTSVGGTEKDVKKRVAVVCSQIGALKQQVLRNRKVSRSVKRKIWNTVLKPKLCYQSESWIMGCNERSRLNATEMKFLRSALGWTLLDKKRNIDIRRDMGKIETVVKEIERGQQCWHGHLLRMDEEQVCKRIFNARVTKSGRGRPRRRWLNQVQAPWKNQGLSARAIHQKAQDRANWRTLCRSLTSGS